MFRVVNTQACCELVWLYPIANPVDSKQPCATLKTGIFWEIAGLPEEGYAAWMRLMLKGDRSGGGVIMPRSAMLEKFLDNLAIIG